MPTTSADSRSAAAGLVGNLEPALLLGEAEDFPAGGQRVRLVDEDVRRQQPQRVRVPAGARLRCVAAHGHPDRDVAVGEVAAPRIARGQPPDVHEGQHHQRRERPIADRAAAGPRQPVVAHGLQPGAVGFDEEEEPVASPTSPGAGRDSSAGESTKIGRSTRGGSSRTRPSACLLLVTAPAAVDSGHSSRWNTPMK